MLHKLLATKSVQRSVAADGEMKRTLGAGQLTLLGIGAIIGAGIFVYTGTASANYAGPAIILSFVLAGLACVFAGLAYAEFAAMIPVSGSAYSYAYATLGEFVAWFIGWNLILEYLVSASAVASSWSGYARSFYADLVGSVFPQSLSTAPISFVPSTGEFIATGSYFNLPAVLIIALVTAICFRGIRQSAAFNAVIVAVKIAVILLFLIFAFKYINPENWKPFIPESQGGDQYGWPGVFKGASIVFFAYIGFDAVSTAAQEAKRPQRDMPIGILASLLICTALYMAVAATLTGIAPYLSLGTEKPVATALEGYQDLFWLKKVVEIGAIAGLTSVILVMIVGQPRIFYAMSHDGLMPKALGKLHPKHHSPSNGTLVTGFVAALLAAFVPFDVLGEMTSAGTLLAFMVVCAGVLVLRRTRPDLQRPFKVPFAWVTCSLGILSCMFLLYSLGQATWIRMAIWTALGILVYFFYGYRRSKLRLEGR